MSPAEQRHDLALYQRDCIEERARKDALPADRWDPDNDPEDAAHLAYVSPATVYPVTYHR